MPSRPAAARPTVALALTVTIGAGLFLLLQILAGPAPGSPGPRSEKLIFAQPQSRAEVMVARLDGGFFAEIGADPSLGLLRKAYSDNPGGAAFRASRPVTGWLAWAGSLGGRRPLLAPALFVITALTMGLATWAVQDGVAARGNRARFPAVAVLMPGMLIVMIAPGLCDPLAAAFSVAAFGLNRRGRFGWAVALFSVAMLTRETTILVAGGVALADMWRSRSLRPALLVAVPVAAFMLWNTVVHQIVGAWFFQAGAGQMAAPFTGLIDGIALWGPMEVVTAGVLVVTLVVMWRTGDPELRAIAAVHVVFALVMGEIVWKVWWGFGRVLLPVQLLALLALYRPTDQATASTADVAGIAAEPSA